MTTSAENNKRIAKNSIFLSIRMILIMCISLYTSRVVLAALGIEDYGIYNVVGGIVSLFAFINGAMSLTTTRFIAYELGKGNEKNIQQVFSTCVMIHILIAILIFILSETVGLYLLEVHFTIPPNRMNAARWVYQLSILNCIIMILSTPYNGAIVAYEKMQAFAYISLFEAVLRLGVAFVITYSFVDNLIVYAILLSIMQFLIRTCYTVYCKMHIPSIRFKNDFDLGKFKQILSFSGWTLFNNASIIACGQGINILLNIFFNPAINAARGIAVQVEMAVSSFSKNFQVAANPQITKKYASGEHEECYSLVMMTSKYAYLLMLLLSLPIFLETDFVLNLWLTVVPDYSVEFIQIILLISLLNTLSEPLNTTVYSTGKVKYYQLISGILLISVLPVSFLLFKIWKDPILVFQVYLIFSVVVFLYKLFYVIRVTSLSFLTYFKIVIFRIFCVTAFSFLILINVRNLLEVNYFLDFIGAVLIYILITFLVIIFVGLTKYEKNKILCRLEKFVYLRKLGRK